MKRAVIISLLLVSILLLSGISGCGSTSSSGSTDSSSSTSSDDDSQRFSSRNGVYSGSITFTAEEVINYPADYEGATGATKHVSTAINFSGYKVGAEGGSKYWEVPVSGTFDYSCATTGNYVPKWKSSSTSSTSFSGVFSAAPEPTMGTGNGSLENGVTLEFGSNALVDEPTWCEGTVGTGASTLINDVITDTFSIIYDNTDKLASEWYPTYFFNKDGETVSFGRTFILSQYTGGGDEFTDTITYSGTVTVVRDK